MKELVRRQFEVPVGLDEAWTRLSRLDDWPSWAHHIRCATVTPPGPLTHASAGVFVLRGGVRSTFRVSVLEPHRRWEWVAKFVAMSVHYDHRFEAIADRETRLTWIIRADGPGEATIGAAFARVYARVLDRAIRRLQAQWRAEPGRTAAVAP